LGDKGVGDFVEASRRLRQEGHQARFALVGAPDPGNPSSISTLQIRRWAQSGVVEWWGHSDDMPHVLGQCHIVVLPSRGEGVPTVLLEAAASGRPVVASDIAGCREVLRPGETGLLVPPGNPLALAQAIASLLGSPDERARMGRLGRDFMKASFDQVELRPGRNQPADDHGLPASSPSGRSDTSSTSRRPLSRPGFRIADGSVDTPSLGVTSGSRLSPHFRAASGG